MFAISRTWGSRSWTLGQGHERQDRSLLPRQDRRSAVGRRAGWSLTDGSSVLYEHTLPDGTRSDYACSVTGRADRRSLSKRYESVQTRTARSIAFVAVAQLRTHKPVGGRTQRQNSVRTMPALCGFLVRRPSESAPENGGPAREGTRWGSGRAEASSPVATRQGPPGTTRRRIGSQHLIGLWVP